MDCPACDAQLSEISIDGTSFDVCTEGCGGIWFDWFELQKVDEAHEQTGAALLAIPVHRSRSIDPERLRSCPRCDNTRLHRHFHGVNRQTEVDECPGCGGFWLDGGELERIRNEYGSDAERRQAADRYFETVLRQAVLRNP
jgi:Zn-finger nucleic acid-binding protein